MSPILRPYQLHKGVAVSQKADMKDELPVKDKDAVTPVTELTNEEKISHALQEILNRKIDKAIVSAESALEAPHIQTETVKVEAQIVTPLEQHTVTPVPVIHSPGSFVTPTETVKAPGQEIKAPVAIESAPLIPQNKEVTQVTTPIVEVVQQPIAQNVVSEPQAQIQTQPIVVTTAPVQTPPQTVAIPPRQASTLSMGPAPAKVHWFDKLFGSAPKNPSQSV
jgi:hypothetical protein